MKCTELRPDDLVRVRIKALEGDHKIADQWESRVLHRNILLPIKTSKEYTFKGQENVQNMALMKANLLMNIHFND